MNKAAYFLCVNSSKDEVAPLVFKELEATLSLEELSWTVDGYPVLEYKDNQENRFLFIRTEVVICQDQKRYQPVLDELKDFDLMGMVNWHGGERAPDKILAIHTVGDVVSGHFPPSKPLFATNIARALEHYRKSFELEDFIVTTEATHWSGIVYGGDVKWLDDVHAPFLDIEIGSTSESYNNEKAVKSIANALLKAFSNKEDYPTLLYIGGMHFEETITAAVLHPTHPVNLTHILPSRWVDNAFYTGDTGIENIKKCINAIDGGIDGFVMHEKLKKPAKDVMRAISEELNLPIIKRKALKTPENTIFYA